MSNSSSKKRWGTSIIAAALAIACLPAALAGCTAQGDENARAVPEGADSAGGIHDAILHDTGTIVDVDIENEQATVHMDETAMYPNDEVVFDFADSLQPKPVTFDAFEPGDRVEVSYFYVESREGVVPGESLAPLEE